MDEGITSFIENLSDSIKDNIKAVIGRRLYMKNLLSKCYYLICPSPWLESVYKEFGFDFNNYKVLPPGLSLQGIKKTNDSGMRESKGENNKKGRTIHVGYAGAMLRHKGIHILIKAIEILNKKGIGANELRLSLFGNSNDKSYLEELKVMGEGLGIEFKGGYRHEELNSIMSDIDILVVPSLWHETYSIIITEALLCGIPVITTDLPSQKNRITDYKSGFLVKPGDPHDLAEKIEYVIKTPEFIDSAKEYIRNIETKKFPSIEDYVSRITEIYNEILY